MASVFEHNAYSPAVVTCECGMRIRPTHKHCPPNYDPEIVYCPFCGKELPMKTEFTSNADSIRTASEDKLIEWYCRHRDCGTCDYGHGVECTLRAWLQQEADK